MENRPTGAYACRAPDKGELTAVELVIQPDDLVPDGSEAEKKTAPDRVGSETAMQEHLGEIVQRIADILIEEQCSVSAAEMILRDVAQKVYAETVVNAHWRQ